MNNFIVLIITGFEEFDNLQFEDLAKFVCFTVLSQVLQETPGHGGQVQLEDKKLLLEISGGHCSIGTSSQLPHHHVLDIANWFNRVKILKYWRLEQEIS